MLFMLVAIISPSIDVLVNALFRQSMLLEPTIIYILVVMLRGTFGGLCLLAPKSFENLMAAFKSSYMGSVVGKEGDDGGSIFATILEDRGGIDQVEFCNLYILVPELASSLAAI